MVASVRKIQRAGIEVQGGFIVGFDSDPKTIFEDQIRFIQDSSIVTAMVGLLTALKGTNLYRRLKSENRLQFWKLMLWTISRRPRCFPLATTLATTLAIYGFHYRKVFEKYL